MEQAEEVSMDSEIQRPESNKRLPVCRLLNKLSDSGERKEIFEEYREVMKYDFVSYNKTLYPAENVIWELLEQHAS
ncbi:hypothetical protein ACQV5M_20990, partial [Leptospira sp. SA-E8]|uniref:hypothetical protein n=1 Tax=Leptospira sp. SA-E8 TaxID=3422259 RepID=UPI003EBC3940